MTPEFNPISPALEQAVSDIRDSSVDPAVIEAAAARVWGRLLEQMPEASRAGHHMGTCADFQALIPEFRAGTLPQARATLVRDHLHQCVACRKIYEGKVVAMPAPRAARPKSYTVRWAAAAVVVAAAGLSVWIAFDQFGGGSGRAIVQTVNGTLFEVTASGLQPLSNGQDLPDGVELRTAKDSSAMLQLRDGSLVELRERSGVITSSTASDLTIRLARGSVIVQAAKRRRGHLYVTTADCRVAVVGTVFSVSAGMKGSRVSVVEGEVHVTQDNRESVLRPGDQHVTSPSLEPLSVRDDIAWSRDRERLILQLDKLRSSLQQLHLPALRYSSRLLNRLPASTVMFASIPNLNQYLGDAQSVLRQQMTQSPELRAWWEGRASHAGAVIDRIRTATEYLGDEIVIVGIAKAGARIDGPVFVAETRRDGFPEFLRKEIPEAAVELRSGVVLFGPSKSAVEAVAAGFDSPAGFSGTQLYQHISQAYNRGAGLVLCADLAGMPERPIAGARYFLAEHREVANQMQTSAVVGFDGPRTGIAGWLADPSPMGSLDYVSPEATVVTAFVAKNPQAIVSEILGIQQRSHEAAEKALNEVRREVGIDLATDIGGSLGGEFSLSMDGPLIPVPSWRLVLEVYDPNRFQAVMHRAVDSYNQNGRKDPQEGMRLSEEQVEGRKYYTLAWGRPNPLTEAHYTFADGYVIAAPSRALVTKALQVKAAGTSIAHSAQFQALEPRDYHNNFSGLVYQNLGTTLSPIIGLLSGLVPQGAAGNNNRSLESLANIKPSMFAAYAEPDRIRIAGSGDLLGNGMARIMRGNLLGLVGDAVPFGQVLGTPGRQPAFK